MHESWYTLSDVKFEEGLISAKAFAPADSLWFSGHFPGEPVLPGIAQLSMVFDLIKEYDTGNYSLRIISYRKIRFKMLVKPGEILYITIKQIEKNTYSFKINTGESIACSGIIAVKANI